MVRNKKETDSSLVKSYIEGNEHSLGILIKRHQQRLYSFIYSKIQDRDLTEDVFQDTFIKVIELLKKGIIMKKVNFYLGLCVFLII